MYFVLDYVLFAVFVHDEDVSLAVKMVYLVFFWISTFFQRSRCRLSYVLNFPDFLL